MLMKVDWISFSVKLPVGEGRGVLETAHLAALEIEELAPDLCDRLGMNREYTPAGGRKPYSHSFSWLNNGVTLFVHPNLPHALVEISGKGCDEILTGDWMNEVLSPIKSRLTRIDIACDMLTDTRPLSFASLRDEKRFKSHSETVSESGETCYVGSKTSNRYARVYRYNPPHERSHLLRSEFVLKAEDAKGTAVALLNDGLLPVVIALGKQFGWKHADWQPADAEPAEIQAYRADRRAGKTLFWLADTVAPLMIRLHQEGTIDAFQWFRENVYPHIGYADSDDQTAEPT